MSVRPGQVRYSTDSGYSNAPQAKKAAVPPTGVPWLDIAGLALNTGGAIMTASAEEEEAKRRAEMERKKFEEEKQQNLIGNFQNRVQLGQSGMNMLDKQVEGARGRTNSPSYRKAIASLVGGR